jgi:AI-2 transport protein TqsA
MKPERERRVQTICLLVISAFLVATALHWLRPIMVPLVLAVFLAIALKPLVDVQARRLKFPRNLAVVSTLLLGFVVLALVFFLVIVSVRQAAGNADKYQKRLEDMVETVSEYLPEELKNESEMVTKGIADISGPALKSVVVGTTSTVMGIISTGVLVFIILCFLLFGARGTQQWGQTWKEIESQTSRYIVTKTTISVVTGVLVGLTLWILGVELALVFGLLTVLLNFIPQIGSIIATLLPIPMVILNPECTTLQVVLVIAIPMVIQNVIGSVIEPKIMGQSLRLHPITLILALIFWGMLWGIVGMFLAAPLTAMIRILLDKSELTKPAADMLGGRLSREAQ